MTVAADVSVPTGGSPGETSEAYPAQPCGAAHAFTLKDIDRADDLFKRSIECDPRNSVAFGRYAYFLWKTRKNKIQAAETFEKAMTLGGNPWNAAAYGTFLDEMGDSDRAEGLLQLAVDLAPTNVNYLGWYAAFLKRRRKDMSRAAQFYERTVELAPQDPTRLSNYAIFLERAIGDEHRGEEFYRRVLAIAPAHTNTLANLGGLLLARGRDEEGLELLQRALRNAQPTETPVVAECWFYLFANGPAPEKNEALRHLKLLLEQSVRSPGWDLTRNIERAQKDGHPESAWLPPLANVLADTAEINILSTWDLWKRL